MFRHCQKIDNFSKSEIESALDIFQTISDKNPDIGSAVEVKIRELMELLEVSVTFDAVLMQSDYKMNDINLDRGIGHKFEPIINGYQIIRLSYENLQRRHLKKPKMMLDKLQRK